MLRNFITYYNQCQQAIESNRIQWNTIASQTKDITFRLSSMKFIEPSEGEEAVVAKLKQLNEDIISTFRKLSEQ